MAGSCSADRTHGHPARAAVDGKPGPGPIAPDSHRGRAWFRLPAGDRAADPPPCSSPLIYRTGRCPRLADATHDPGGTHRQMDLIRTNRPQLTLPQRETPWTHHARPPATASPHPDRPGLSTT